ncbi:MAG: DUF3568 family protein [Candidatus Omnitrophica bacterium]|nr:DUF3568 family protein [Candidatus Omnitrophota bacterium]
MKKVIFSLFCAVFLSLNLAGCVPLIVGGAVGAVGGYAVSKDTIQGDTDKPFDAIWNSALEIARLRGTIKKDDYDKGRIEFIARDSSLVWISVSRLTQTANRVRVSSRRFHFPNLALAQDIFVKVMEDAR